MKKSDIIKWIIEDVLCSPEPHGTEETVEKLRFLFAELETALFVERNEDESDV